MYKILLSDNSFIVADEDFQLNLYKGLIKKSITIKDYLTNSKKYKDFYLVDYINNKKEKRQFTIDKIENINIPIGSRIKLAKDIQINDLIMGKDGMPRRVKELHTGEDEMFEININENSYIVNGGHILALVDKETGEHLEMPVNIYMQMDKEFQSHYVMEIQTN